MLWFQMSEPTENVRADLNLSTTRMLPHKICQCHLHIFFFLIKVLPSFVLFHLHALHITSLSSVPFGKEIGTRENADEPKKCTYLSTTLSNVTFMSINCSINF